MLVEAGTECLIRHFYRHGDSFIAISWSKRPINLEPVALGIMSYDQWRRSHDRQNMRTNVSWNFYVNSNIWIYPVFRPWVLNILRHCALQWRYIERDGVSNHQPRYYLLNCLFRCRSRKTSKLRVTGLCAWNSPLTGGYPAQKANNAENGSIWWRHHGNVFTYRDNTSSYYWSFPNETKRWQLCGTGDVIMLPSYHMGEHFKIVHCYLLRAQHPILWLFIHV